MIKFNKEKFFIALVCTVVGWSIGFLMGKKNTEDRYAKHNRNIGISRFFGMQIPGLNSQEESPSLVERFFKKWDKESNKNQNHEQDDDDDFFSPHGGSLFDKPLSLFGIKNAQPKISTRDDENFVYMEIDLESFDKNSLSAKVENDTVIIEGEQKLEEGGSSMSSHFYQSFPVPSDTDPSKVDMNHENNKLVLKFPKLKR